MNKSAPDAAGSRPMARLTPKVCFLAPLVAHHSTVAELDWVTAQTMERKQKQLEAEDEEYAQRLAKARQREAMIRKAAKARVRKRMVCAVMRSWSEDIRTITSTY